MQDAFGQRVAHLFGRVLTAAPGERAALLAAHREREPDVVRRVEWMLADRESELPTRVGTAPPAAADADRVALASRPDRVAPASRRCDIAPGDDTRASNDDGNPAPRGNAPDEPALLDAGAAPGAPRDAATPSGVFPGYEIVRRLSQGGQGVVYQAVETATKRKVALKVLLEGVHASKSARRRFEREIEIVAQFRHPHIISVLHAGQSGDGRQFYAMDYVRGEPLTTFVRSKKLPLDAALDLFATLCDAVQYAHQRGIIHRDLKPSNVLVDTEGRLRVLDFGLAKSLGATDHTLISLTGQAVGTLAYMSPEQTRGNPDEIDTRADVYALGVMLYEALTDRHPYPVAGQIADVLHHISETEPRPPSQVGSRDAGAIRAASAAQQRELGWIPLKALRKDRNQRYRSAAELADDLRNFLAGRPLLAVPESAGYRLRKFVRRYRGPVAAAVLLFVALLLGLGGTLWQARRADERATAAQRAERAARAAEAEQRRLAESESAARQREREQRELAERRSKELAAALSNLSSVLVDQGRGTEAEPLLREALSICTSLERPDEWLYLGVQENLGALLAQRGRVEEALPLLEYAAERRATLLGPDHMEVGVTLSNLGSTLRMLGRSAEAERYFRQAQEVFRRAVGPSHPEYAISLNDLALVLNERGELEQAETLWREALAVFERDGCGLPCIAVLNNLGRLAEQRGELESAEAMLVRAVELARAQLGAEHREYGRALNGLAAIVARRGDHKRSEVLYREALAAMRGQVEPGDWRLGVIHFGIARALVGQNRLAEAHKSFRYAAQAIEGKPGVPAGLVRDLAAFGDRLCDAMDQLDPNGPHAEAAGSWREQRQRGDR